MNNISAKIVLLIAGTTEIVAFLGQKNSIIVQMSKESAWANYND